MRTLDLHSDFGETGAAFWYLVRDTLGPTGESWEVTAQLGSTLDKDDAAAMPGLFAPLLSVPKEKVEEASYALLAGLLDSEPASLDNPLPVICLQAGPIHLRPGLRGAPLHVGEGEYDPEAHDESDDILPPTYRPHRTANR